MASQKAQKGSRWGFLQHAVASVEAGLDTILAEDEQPGKKPAASTTRQSKDNLSSSRPSAEITTSGASTPGNDRLQARLAKAMVQKSQSRSESPAPGQAAHTTAEGTSTLQNEPLRAESIAEADLDPEETRDGRADEAAASAYTGSASQIPDESGQLEESARNSVLPRSKAELSTYQLETVRRSTEDSTLYKTATSSSVRPSGDSFSEADPAQLHSQLEAEASRQQLQEELDQHVERIDALQAKLKYLSAEAARTAHKRAAEADTGSTEKRMAEKDEKIALLMEEGTALQKSDLTLRQTIKKIRSQSANSEKTQSEITQRAERAERDLRVMEDRAKRAEATVKRSEQRLAASAQATSSLDAVTKERNALTATLADIKAQLSRATARADAAESKATTAQLDRERKKAADLQDDLTSAKVERELSEEKLRREIADLQASLAREKAHARAVETEMLGEQAALESKLESFRARAEEAAVASTDTGDAHGQAKLLRQIETLQRQYAAASQNWQGIEGSLLSRITSLEKERDDVAGRESEVRRKLREATAKWKRCERELEEALNRLPEAEKRLEEAEEEGQRLARKIKQLETDLQQAHKDMEEHRAQAERDTQRRIEEEKAKLTAALSSPRTESPMAAFRKASGLGLDVHDRPNSRRSSIFPADMPLRQYSAASLKGLSNGGSGSGNIAETPSIITSQDPDEYFNNMPPTPASQHGNQTNSPRTLHDLISTSTVGAGPSVQLVERMSANVRRLESEKAASKDEIARLMGQRDESRGEVVNLMREVEEKRDVSQKLKALQEEHEKLAGRHQTMLELLGEKSELVEELRADIADVKLMYRQLADTMGK